MCLKTYYYYYYYCIIVIIITGDDLQQWFLAQHSVAWLLQHCFEWLQHCSNIASLCCAKNHCWESPTLIVISIKFALGIRVIYSCIYFFKLLLGSLQRNLLFDYKIFGNNLPLGVCMQDSCFMIYEALWLFLFCLEL